MTTVRLPAAECTPVYPICTKTVYIQINYFVYWLIGLVNIIPRYMLANENFLSRCYKQTLNVDNIDEMRTDRLFVFIQPKVLDYII